MKSLPHTIRVLERGIAENLHLGAQLFVWRDGRVVADWGVGLARQGVPMTTHSVTLWRSAGKPLTAVAVAQLKQRGLLDYDEPIARHIPEFGVEGKDAITARHVLTHTAGFRYLVGGARDWDERIERIARMKIERQWVPGERAGYDAGTSWYILAELIRRLDGRSYQQYMREEVLAPAGMTETYIGVDPETQAELGRRLALNYKRSEGGRLEPDGSLNDAEAVAAVDPGGNVRGPVGALGRFYIAMLDQGAVPDGERRLVDAETAERMLDRQRVGMSDRTFGATIDWGLGFMLNSRHHGGDYPYDFGPHASRDAFGHGGRQCANAFADPEHRLVVAWVANGLPGEPRHQQRNHAINAAIYEDLGLA